MSTEVELNTMIAAMVNSQVTYAQRLGVFESVNSHEPKNAPGAGVTCAVWFRSLAPATGQSGLASTTCRIEFTNRLYKPMLAPSQDEIDPKMMSAAMLLMQAYSAGFDFGAQIRNVDLLGAYGQGLSATAGYLDVDGKWMRTVDVVVPLIVNDVFSQGVAA